MLGLGSEERWTWRALNSGFVWMFEACPQVGFRHELQVGVRGDKFAA